MTEGLDHETGREDYTKDGSVDLKGNPVRRSKSGGWTACSFIVVYEVFERMAYFGIAVNLVFYLTNKIHMGTVTSSNNVTNWVGTVWMTPILGAYVADTHLGRYWTFIIGSIIYLLIINAVKKKCPHIPLVLYINGNGGLLERMKDTGADVIGLDWTVDMADGRRRLGSQISVQGNVDPAYLFSPLPILTDEIHRVVRRAGPRGHILNLGHSVLVRTPEDAAAHFFNIVRDSEA